MEPSKLPGIDLPDATGALQLHEAFLERATETEGTDANGWALGAFLTMRALDQLAYAASDPDAVLYQLQGTAKYLNELSSQSAEVGHLANIVNAALATHTSGDFRLLWSPLSTFAAWLERELRFAEALDVLDTTAQLVEGRDDAAAVAVYLHRGRALRQTGRLSEATASYAAAGALAGARGDTHSELLSRIGRGIVLQKLGNLPASEKILREVRRDAVRLEDRDAEARATHDLAVTYVRQERAAEAVGFAFRAFQLYDDQDFKLRALADLGSTLQEIGHLSAAQDAFELVLAGNVTPDLRINAMLELMGLAGFRGDRVSFERQRRALENLDAQLPPSAKVDFEIKAGQGLATFGKRSQAKRYLESAVRRAEEYHLNEYLFRAEGALDELEKELAPNREEPVHHAEVMRVADELRELRVGV